MQDVDGIEWVDVTPDRGTLHAIGLSTETLDGGEEYARMVFLHELAHIFCGREHGPEFHACLDGFIARLNAETRDNIVNNYQGLPETAQKGR